MTTKTMRSGWWIAGLAGLLVPALVGVARADFESGLINVDFDEAEFPDFMLGQLVLAGPGDRWNGIDAGATDQAPLALRDAENSPTDVTIAWVNADVQSDFRDSFLGDVEPIFRYMMDDYLGVSSPGTATVTLAGLTPSTAYRLVLYTMPQLDVERSTTFTVGSQSKTAVADGRGHVGYVENKHYVVFPEATSDANGRLAIDFTFGGTGEAPLEGNLNGLQIAPVLDPPSPAACGPEQRLGAPEGRAFDRFGSSVAIDGDTALVGMPGDDDHREGVGSVRVFTRQSGVWAETQVLTPAADAEFVEFGRSVAIGGDTALVGAPLASRFLGDEASAYVFTRTNGVWSQQARLTTADEVDYRFGVAVALSGDEALVGAPSFGSGSAYVFSRSGGVWTEKQELTAPVSAGQDDFGASVALHRHRMLVGAPRDSELGTRAGAAFAFVRLDGTWSLLQKLTASDGGSLAFFGLAVSVSEGSALVSGGRGGVYAFSELGGEWSEQQRLTASDGFDGNIFGSSLSQSADAALIGARADDDDNGTRSGSAYLFRRQDGNWVEQRKLTANDGAARDGLGTPVALSGGIAVVGAPDDDDSFFDSGSVAVFDVRSRDHVRFPAGKRKTAPVPVSYAPSRPPQRGTIALDLLRGSRLTVRIAHAKRVTPLIAFEVEPDCGDVVDTLPFEKFRKRKSQLKNLPIEVTGTHFVTVLDLPGFDVDVPVQFSVKPATRAKGEITVPPSESRFVTVATLPGGRVTLRLKPAKGERSLSTTIFKAFDSDGTNLMAGQPENSVVTVVNAVGGDVRFEIFATTALESSVRWKAKIKNPKGHDFEIGASR